MITFLVVALLAVTVALGLRTVILLPPGPAAVVCVFLAGVFWTSSLSARHDNLGVAASILALGIITLVGILMDYRRLTKPRAGGLTHHPLAALAGWQILTSAYKRVAAGPGGVHVYSSTAPFLPANIGLVYDVNAHPWAEKEQLRRFFDRQIQAAHVEGKPTPTVELEALWMLLRHGGDTGNIAHWHVAEREVNNARLRTIMAEVRGRRNAALSVPRAGYIDPAAPPTPEGER